MNFENPDRSGMTTNERLYSAGLLDRFDVAAKSRNRDEMIQILKQVGVPAADATTITNKILADPGLYGY